MPYIRVYRVLGYNRSDATYCSDILFSLLIIITIKLYYE